MDKNIETQFAKDVHVLAAPVHAVADFIKMIAFLIVAPIAGLVWLIYCLATGTPVIDADTWQFFKDALPILIAIAAVVGPLAVLYLMAVTEKLWKISLVAYIGLWIFIGGWKLDQFLEHKELMATAYKTQIDKSETFNFQLGQSKASLEPILASCTPNKKYKEIEECNYSELMQCDGEAMAATGTLEFDNGKLSVVQAIFDTKDTDDDGIFRVNHKQLKCIDNITRKRFGPLKDKSDPLFTPEGPGFVPPFYNDLPLYGGNNNELVDISVTEDSMGQSTGNIVVEYSGTPSWAKEARKTPQKQ